MHQSRECEPLRPVNGMLSEARRIARAIVGDDMELYLYGSRARGDAAPDSDWDLLLIVPDGARRRVEGAVHDALYQLGLDCDAVVSCIVMERSEWELLQQARSPLARAIHDEGVRL